MSGTKNPALFEQGWDWASAAPDGPLATKITLRDLFAAAAMAGQCAGYAAWSEQARAAKASDEDAFAHWAYSFADAMLRGRAKAEGR